MEFEMAFYCLAVFLWDFLMTWTNNSCRLLG